MTSLEQKLLSYSEPSSPTEKDKQERALRMVKAAVDDWANSVGVSVSYLVKGSYANNTNVKQESDVDIAVIQNGMYYYDDSRVPHDRKLIHNPVEPPKLLGNNLRRNLEAHLKIKFGSDCDITGNTAIELAENGGRVKADIVPAYHHRDYFLHPNGTLGQIDGHTVYRKDGTNLINYPEQQLANGKAKNIATNGRYKQLVRILKRAEDELVKSGKMNALPSYFMECLVYNVPNSAFTTWSQTPLTQILMNVVSFVWIATEPGGDAQNWYEPNAIKELFAPPQKWTMADARTLMNDAWNLFNLTPGSS